MTRRRFSCRYIITLPRACANVWRHKFTYFCRKKNDVLRHDVVSFEVEPLTNAHSFEACLNPVPICFGVIREFMQHSLGVYGVLKDAFSNFSSEGYLDFPLLPFGLSSPVSD